MKATIKGKKLILFPKTKKEVKQSKRYLKSNAAEAIIPKSRKQFQNLYLDLPEEELTI